MFVIQKSGFNDGKCPRGFKGTGTGTCPWGFNKHFSTGSNCPMGYTVSI